MVKLATLLILTVNFHEFTFFATLYSAPNEKADDVHTNIIMPEGSSFGWKRK
jgi:hypothetical protein